MLNLYEVRHRAEEIAGEKKAIEIIEKIKENCRILEVDEQIALEEGKLKLKYKA